MPHIVPFYHIKSCRIALPTVRQIDNNQKSPNCPPPITENPMTRNYHKKVKQHKNNSVNIKVCHISHWASMEGSKNITLYTQVHQFFLTVDNKNNWLTQYFHKKSPKKYLSCPKIPTNSPSLIGECHANPGKAIKSSAD